MIFAWGKFKKYLESTENGYKVAANCPADILAELKQMNNEYLQIAGEELFVFDD